MGCLRGRQYCQGQAGIRNEFAKPGAAEGLRVACETVIITHMWLAHSPSPNPAEARNALQAMLVILERLTGSRAQEATATLRQLIEMLQSAAPCTVPRDAYARFALDRFFVTRFEAMLNPWLEENLGPDRFLVQTDPKVNGESENKRRKGTSREKEKEGREASILKWLCSCSTFGLLSAFL